MRVLSKLLFASLTLFSLSCSAASDGFKEGEQYKRVREESAAPDPKRILVQEVFWYGCPHCYAFDPKIEAWKAKKPGDVDFDRIPSTLGHAQGEVHQRAFYVAKVLGLGDKLHKPLFDAVQQQGLGTQDTMRAFFVKQGVDGAKFDSYYNSFPVVSNAKRATDQIMSYAIGSVPTVVVGGKYYTNATMTGDFDNMVKCIDFLVDKVRKERGKK